jgi:hypothetical protein
MMGLVPWRLWLYGGALVTLTAGLWGIHRHGYTTGYEAGSAAIVAAWDADNALREKTRQRAQAAAEEELRRQRAINQDIEKNLTARLDAADSRGRDLARRLRDALTAGTCPLPQPGNAASPADGTSEEPDNQATLGAALADHLAACESDAQRLTDLQTWVGRIQREVVIPDASREP